MSNTTFNVLGFTWDRSIFSASIEDASIHRATAIYHQMTDSIVYETGLLLGSPISFTSLQTLASGVSVGGYKLSDVDKMAGIIDATRLLRELIRKDSFALNKITITALNNCMAARGASRSPFDAELFDQVVVVAKELINPHEKALLLGMFLLRNHLFKRSNTTTALLMMNGVLMSNGINAISIHPDSIDAFRTALEKFLFAGDATHVMQLLLSQNSPKGEYRNFCV